MIVYDLARGQLVVGRSELGIVVYDYMCSAYVGARNRCYENKSTHTFFGGERSLGRWTTNED